MSPGQALSEIDHLGCFLCVVARGFRCLCQSSSHALSLRSFMCIRMNDRTHQELSRTNEDEYRDRRRSARRGDGGDGASDETGNGRGGAAPARSIARAGRGVRRSRGSRLGRRPRRDARRTPPGSSSVILVDSSVWIARLRGRETAATAKLRALVPREPLLIGDLILLEALQGARDEAHAARIERDLRRYRVVPLLDDELAPRAARNYRALRDLGVTIRKTADLIIATYCIERGRTLLHDDRDFDPIEEHLGLRVA